VYPAKEREKGIERGGGGGLEEMRGIGRDVDGDVDVVGEDRRVCLGESGWFWRRGVNGVGLGERMGNGGVQMSFVEEEKIRQRKGTAAKLP